MPSWGDGSNSSDSILGDLTPMDYAPDTILDPSFTGIAVGCGTVCSVHKLEPRQCVAFDGADTGRRFLMCQVENQVENCGIHSWVDDEWCDTLKHCLLKLW
uniref:Uncharacterized protein n=1 Tax=Avena sativa TaxID=4498 RepID=A0ACD6A6I4_AVESA